MQNQKVDIIIYSMKRGFIAAIETNNQQNLDTEAVVYYRHQLAENNLVPPVRYYMIVSQDMGYLWIDASQEDFDAPPTHQFPMRPVVERYAASFHPEERIGRERFEDLVHSWTLDLTTSQPFWGSFSLTEEPEKTLAATGFIEAIKNADILYEPKDAYLYRV